MCGAFVPVKVAATAALLVICLFSNRADVPPWSMSQPAPSPVGGLNPVPALAALVAGLVSMQTPNNQPELPAGVSVVEVVASVPVPGVACN